MTAQASWIEGRFRLSIYERDANCTYVLTGPWVLDAQCSAKAAMQAYLLRAAEQLNKDAASLAALAAQLEGSK